MKRFITIFLIVIIEYCASQSTSLAPSPSTPLEPSTTPESSSPLSSSSSVDSSSVSMEMSATTTSSMSNPSPTQGIVSSTPGGTTTVTSSKYTTSASVAQNSAIPTPNASASPSSTPSLSLSAASASPGGSSSTVSPSPSMSQQPASSVAPTQTTPSSTYQTCSQNDVYCKNNGECYINGLYKRICVCRGDYYGPTCANEANDLYKPLVYAFGGSTGFLLLVICIALIITCRKSSHSSASRDLGDDFNSIKMRATMNDGMIMEE